MYPSKERNKLTPNPVAANVGEIVQCNEDYRSDKENRIHHISMGKKKTLQEIDTVHFFILAKGLLMIRKETKKLFLKKCKCCRKKSGQHVCARVRNKSQKKGKKSV